MLHLYCGQYKLVKIILTFLSRKMSYRSVKQNTMLLPAGQTHMNVTSSLKNRP